MEQYAIGDAIQIFHGDCIEGSRRHIEDQSIDLLIADPPFSIAEKRLASFYSKTPKASVIPGYVFAPDNYYQFCIDWMVQAYRVLKKHGSMYVVSGWSQGHIIQTALVRVGFVLINSNSSPLS
jgi:DNA modification methylase